MKCDLKDFFVMGIIGLGWITASVFLFKHPDIPNFSTWATFSGVVVCAYKWIDYKDSKVPDAPALRDEP